jgi:hypothetical protein
MRKIAAVLVTAGLVLGAGALAAPAGASAPGKTSAFCKQLKNLDVDLPSSDNAEGITEESAAKAAKAFKQLSRRSTGKLRQATKTMSSAFQDIADGDSPTTLASVEYAKAAGTFAVASLKCISANITLPDITLPDLGN